MLRVFRRHRRDCPHRHPYHRNCRCTIHIEGNLNGELIRKSSGTSSWTRATKMVLEAEERGAWELPEGTTVGSACKGFLSDAKDGRRLSPSALKGYTTLLRRLQ